MTEAQTFYVDLLRQMRELEPSVEVFTDYGLQLQASAADRRRYGSPGNSLNRIKESGVVEQCRLWLHSPRMASGFSMVRAWALAGVIERPGPRTNPITPDPVVNRLRELRDINPGAAFYCAESIGGARTFHYDGNGYHLLRAGVVMDVWVCDEHNQRLHCYDLAEPRTLRQEFAHRLWRRPAHSSGDAAYGCYNKRMFAMMLDWAEAAAVTPDNFVTLTFGTTPVPFPRNEVTAYGPRRWGNGTILLIGGEQFIVKESRDTIATRLGR